MTCEHGEADWALVVTGRKGAHGRGDVQERRAAAPQRKQHYILKRLDASRNFENQCDIVLLKIVSRVLDTGTAWKLLFLEGRISLQLA